MGATFVVHAFSCAPNNSVMINNSHIKGLQTHVLHNKKVSNGCLSGVQGGGGGVFIVNKGRESCIPFEKFLYWIVAKGTLFFLPLNPQSDQHLSSSPNQNFRFRIIH